MAAVKLARGIVARGRTVMGQHPTERRTVSTPDGKLVEVPSLLEYGPGAEIELPPKEIDGLRAAGYLIDTALPELPVSNGPRFAPAPSNEPTRIDAGA